MGRKLKIDLDISLLTRALPRGNRRSDIAEEIRKANKLEKQAKAHGWKSYYDRYWNDTVVYPDGMTFQQQMQKAGRDEWFVEEYTADTEKNRDLRAKRMRQGVKWMEGRKDDLSKWDAADEDERPIHPAWRGQKDWKWSERSKAMVAAAALASIPRGESKGMLSVAPYSTPRSFTQELAVYVGGNESYAQFLVAFIVILFTMIAWQAATNIKNFVLMFWRGRKERDWIPQIVTFRTIGVQSQCTYTWHENDPRFKAYQNGFRRSGEVTIESSE